MEKIKKRSAKRVSAVKSASAAKPVKKAASAAKPAHAVRPAPAKKNVHHEHLHRLVRDKAYELYVIRGYSTGNDLDDWLGAETLVRQELGI